MGDGVALPSYGGSYGTNNGYSGINLPSAGNGGLFGSGVGVGAGVGGLFGAASGFFPTSTTSTTNSNSNSNGTSTTNPVLSAQAQNFLNQLQGQYTNLLNNPNNLSGYQATQANSINGNAQLASQASNQMLAARGLSTSPVAAAVSNTNNQNRVGQLNSLSQSIPLLQEQMQQQNDAAGTSFFNSIPRGSTTNQNQNQTQNSTTTQKSGGGIGGLLSGLGSLASLIPF